MSNEFPLSYDRLSLEVEIARRVRKTPHTVRTWLTSGRAHLLQRMEAER